MNQIKVFSAAPLGVAYDPDEDAVSLSFVLDDGDHLHIQIARSQLQTLTRHIDSVVSQLPAEKRRGV